MSLERDPDQLYASTTRVPFNFEEKMVKIKRDKNDDDGEEKNRSNKNNDD